MNIEMTDLDMILNYLETTSLEPHDDYTSEFTYKDQKILYKYIKQLQQKNKKQFEKIKEVLTLLENFNADQVCTHTTRLSNEIEKILKEVSE